jgi:hypothetical protein
MVEKKYKTLMGTETNKKPSKERQYNIDAYKKGSKSKALASKKEEKAEKGKKREACEER